MRRFPQAVGALCLVLAVSLVPVEPRAQGEGAAREFLDCVIYPSLVADLGSAATGLL